MLPNQYNTSGLKLIIKAVIAIILLGYSASSSDSKVNSS